MRTFFAIMLLAGVASAQNVPLTATDTGLTAAAIAAVKTTDPIHMEGKGKYSNQLSMTWAVTAGTSATIRVTCYESKDKSSNYAQIGFCDTSSPSVCHPDVREFTLSEYTAVGGVLYVKTRWEIAEQWVKCSIVDPLAGSGTVTVTGTRSRQ